MPSQAISSQFLSIAEYEKCGRAFTYSVHLDEPCLLVGSDMKIISHEKRVQKTTSDGQDRQKSPWSSEWRETLPRRISAEMRRGRDKHDLHLGMLDFHSLAKQDTICYTCSSRLHCKIVKA